MDLARIAEYNTWWAGGGVRRELCPDFKRDLFPALWETKDRRSATLLRGPRRTGKSTMFYQTVDRLLSEGIDPRKILYFSFDAEKGVISDLVEIYRNQVLHASLDSVDRIFIFLDEVHKSSDWSEEVKRLYDLYPNIKFFLSGSVSAELDEKSTESLAGRYREIVLMPMSFGEYLRMKRVAPDFKEVQLDDVLILENNIYPLFDHYLKSGGFPELAFELDEMVFKEYILSSIVRKAIYVDIARKKKIADPDALMGLLEIISSSPGMTINMDNLGSAVGKDRKTISAYLRYLEDCMLIRLVSNGRRSVIARIRKGMKAYPTSTGIVHAFKGYTPDDVTRGKILETAVANELRSDRYWRQGRKEIDFILGGEGEIAIEVKSSGEGKFHFKAYASKANIKKAYVISDRRTGKSSAEGIEYDIVPAWALCAGASIPGLNG